MPQAARQLEPEQDRPYLPVHLPHHVWAELVAEELALLSGDPSASEKERAWAAARAPRVRDCGRRALVQRCRCGAAVPGSLTALPGHGGWCETRGCPVCSRRRSAKLAGLADRAQAALPSGSSWWLLTGTTRRDPLDPAECTWQAMRARARRCRAGMSALVNRLRKRLQLSAAWAGIELAGNGHIHAHLLIALDPGGAAQAAQLEAAIRASGFDEVADARPAEAAAVVEVVKYAVKAPSWEKCVDPDHARPALINPIIAARFALATRSMRLLERYGAARGVPIEVPQAEAAEAAAPVPCPCCGSASESDRWWYQGQAARLADWARRSWAGREGLRLCGTAWPRSGPRKSEVVNWAPELFSGSPIIVVDSKPAFRY